MKPGGDLIWEWDEAPGGLAAPELLDAYAGLSHGDGRALALRALELLEAMPRSEPDSYRARFGAIEVSVRLACYRPGVLDGLHTRLLEQGVPEEYGWRTVPPTTTAERWV